MLVVAQVTCGSFVDEHHHMWSRNGGQRLFGSQHARSFGHIRAATTPFTVPYGASDLQATTGNHTSVSMRCPGIELQSRRLVDGRELLGLGLQPRDDLIREPMLHTLKRQPHPY